MKRIELEPSRYGQLGSVQMSCDKPLTEKREIKPPFVNKSAFYTITGPPGSGKTTWVLSLLKRAKKREDNVWYRIFADIIWISPESSRQSIRNGPLDDLNPDDMYELLDYNVHDKIHANRKKYGDRNLNQLLIVDDSGSMLKSHETQQILETLSNNRRHLKLTIVCMAQYLTSIPRSVRSNISMAVIFKPSRQDFDTVRSELTDLTKAQFNHIAQVVFKTNHDCLIINRENGSMYKNLQKINMV